MQKVAAKYEVDCDREVWGRMRESLPPHFLTDVVDACWRMSPNWCLQAVEQKEADTSKDEAATSEVGDTVMKSWSYMSYFAIGCNAFWFVTCRGVESTNISSRRIWMVVVKCCCLFVVSCGYFRIRNWSSCLLSLWMFLVFGRHENRCVLEDDLGIWRESKGRTVIQWQDQVRNLTWIVAMTVSFIWWLDTGPATHGVEMCW